jgi:hypothetical protein
MTGPQDPAASGGDRLRAGHADREQVVETLKDAFVPGRLTRDEFDARAGRALAARTFADLAALTAGIPPGPAAAGSARPAAPRRRRPLARAAAGSGSCLIIAAAAIWAHPLLDPGASSAPYESWAALMALLALFALVAALGFLGYGAAASWELRRSRGQLPPGPGPGGHDLDGERRGETGQDPVLRTLRTNQPRADLRVHKSRPRRQHIPARADRAPRACSSACGCNP